MPIISPEVWITREGVHMEIKKMPSSHLLAAIHFIERSRFYACFEVFQDLVNNGPIEGAMEYYSRWPIQYANLVKEAEHRNLIHRSQETNTTTAVVKTENKELTKGKK